MLYRTSYHICTVAGERQVDRDRENEREGEQDWRHWEQSGGHFCIHEDSAVS